MTVEITFKLRCHECGQTAKWLGIRPSTVFEGGWWNGNFCDACKKSSAEAKHITKWMRLEAKS